MWEIAEVAVTCHDDGGLCGWGAPNFPVLRDAWRDLKSELAPYIREVRESEWTVNFHSGGRLECWSMDSGIVARGRKYHKFILDEAGLIPHLGHRFDAEIEPTLGDYDGTLIVGSTPNLVGPELLRWFALGQREGTGWKSWRWASTDNPAVAANMARLIAAARARGVPEWVIQQEYYAIPAEADTSFFVSRLIEEHRGLHAVPPLRRATIDVPFDLYADRDQSLVNHRGADVCLTVDPERGPWRLWCEVEDGAPIIEGPTAIGCDFGYGVGSSNTVFSVGESETRRKIAEFVDPGVTPEEAARLVAAAGYWFAGTNGPALVNFEVNGPGEVFIKALRALRYPRIYREPALPGKVKRKDTGQYGWRSTQEARETLLGQYRADLAGGRFVNPSDQALTECLTYRVDERGRVQSEYEASLGGEQELARVPHGDRVVADAVLNAAFPAAGRIELQEQGPEPGSRLWYENQAKAKARKLRRW